MYIDVNIYIYMYIYIYIYIIGNKENTKCAKSQPARCKGV